MSTYLEPRAALTGNPSRFETSILPSTPSGLLRRHTPGVDIMTRSWTLTLFSLALLAGCTDTGSTPDPNTAAETDTLNPETSADAGGDPGLNPGTDTGTDPAADTGTDPGTDTLADPGTDTLTDPGTDTGADLPSGEAWSGPVEETVMTHGGIDFHVRIAGEGDAVVLVINGGPGQSPDYCEDTDALADLGVRVVTFDQRGTGDTPRPGDDDYALETYTGDIEALRQFLGVDTMHLMGHSFGGMLAMGYVAAHPDRVASLQLYSSSPVVQADTDDTEFLARIAAFEADGTFPAGYNEIEGSDDCAPYFQTIWPVYLSDPTFPLTSGLLNTTCDIYVFQSTWGQNWWGWDYSDVKSYGGPVGIYWGEADPFLSESLSIAPYFKGTNPEERAFPGCGHYWEECLDAFLDQAATFLQTAL